MQLQLPIVGGSVISRPRPFTSRTFLPMNGCQIAVAVVVRPDGDEPAVLVVKRAQEDSSCPRWVFPGGKLKDGESARAAAARELREETGVRATGAFDIGSRIHPLSRAEVHYVAFKDVRAAGILNREKAIADVKWLPLDEAIVRLGPTLYEKVSSYLLPGQRCLPSL